MNFKTTDNALLLTKKSAQNYNYNNFKTCDPINLYQAKISDFTLPGSVELIFHLELESLQASDEKWVRAVHPCVHYINRHGQAQPGCG